MRGAGCRNQQIVEHAERRLLLVRVGLHQCYVSARIASHMSIQQQLASSIKRAQHTLATVHNHGPYELESNEGVKPEGTQASSANRDQQQRCHLGIKHQLLSTDRCLDHKEFVPCGIATIILCETLQPQSVKVKK